MAKARKDDRGRALRKGEVQRASDKRYMYTYTDPLGRRRFIYANDLAELREKEKKLVRDQLDGLDLYVAGKATVNDTFDRYLSTKFQLRDTTRSNYIYMYDKYVISKTLLLLYISILLHISMRMDVAMNAKVCRNIAESPRANQAVSENGIYMFRKTTANNTEKVTVPIN